MQSGVIVTPMDAKVKWTSRALAALCLVVAAGSPAQGNLVYRWVNDEGQVIFSPTLPPEAAGKPYDVLRGGIVIESVKIPDKVERPQEVEEEEPELVPLHTPDQKRQMQDRLLLLKYRSADDIRAEMQVELDHLQYDFRLLESTTQSLSNSLKQLITAAANRQRAGLEVEPEQLDRIDGVRRRMDRTDEELQKLQVRSDAIRARFQKDIDRYLLLTEPDQAG